MTANQRPGFLKRRVHRMLDAPPPFLSVPPQTRTERAARRVAERFGDLTPRAPETFELSRLFRRVQIAWRDRRLAVLSRRDVRLAPYIFFYPDASPESWLGLDPAFMRVYDAQAPGSNSPRATIALLHGFLKSCRPEFPAYDHIRALLYRRFFQDEPHVRLNRWRERCRRYSLLQDHNHMSLLQSWRNAGEPAVAEHLQEAGLAPSLDKSELIRRVALQLLSEADSALRTDNSSARKLKSATSWLVLDGRLRFDTLRVEIAGSFLGPFVSAKPREELAGDFREFFLNHFGDPRTSGVRGWVGVPDEQRAVMMRILVGQTLDDFFRLLDRTADKQWRYRKAFWSAYEKSNVILDAWVALGAKAQAYAGSELRASSGRLVGYGIQVNQSILLMKIEGVTIAEWSHNGMCRFWLPANPAAPSLYQPQYKAERLRGDGLPDEEIAHRGSESGKWQENFARWIASYTGVRLTRSQYMPRNR